MKCKEQNMPTAMTVNNSVVHETQGQVIDQTLLLQQDQQLLSKGWLQYCCQPLRRRTLQRSTSLQRREVLTNSKWECEAVVRCRNNLPRFNPTKDSFDKSKLPVVVFSWKYSYRLISQAAISAIPLGIYLLLCLFWLYSNFSGRCQNIESQKLLFFFFCKIFNNYNSLPKTV